MTKLTGVAVAALLLGLTGCNAPISKSLPNDILSSAAAGPIGAQVETDLADTQYNLQQAVAVGALQADDPAPACVAQAVASLGIGATNPNFTPKIGGVVSFASVAYIRAQQLKQLAASNALKVPVSCEAVIGRMQLDALAAAIKAGPGGGLLPVVQ